MSNEYKNVAMSVRLVPGSTCDREHGRRTGGTHPRARSLRLRFGPRPSARGALTRCLWEAPVESTHRAISRTPIPSIASAESPRPALGGHASSSRQTPSARVDPRGVRDLPASSSGADDRTGEPRLGSDPSSLEGHIQQSTHANSEVRLLANLTSEGAIEGTIGLSHAASRGVPRSGKQVHVIPTTKKRESLAPEDDGLDRHGHPKSVGPSPVTRIGVN